MKGVTVITGCVFAFVLQLLTPSPVIAVEPPEDGQGTSHPIVEGSASAPGGQGWMVALVRDSSQSLPARHFCGGTLIANTWVLTAAHCVNDVEVDDFGVIVGREQLAGTDGDEVAVAEVILHPFFDPATLANDIALIRLARPATLPSLQRATKADDAALTGTTVTVFGWGFHSFRENYGCELNFLEPGGSHADYWCETKVYSYGAKGVNLEEGRQRLVSYAECDARYREFLIARGVPQPLPEEPYFSEALTPLVLCAWDQDDVQAPCFGDSGGPLVGHVNGVEVLLGVVSFAHVGDCATQGQLGIYARISSYATFIDDAMGREQALGFAALCPRSPEPQINFRPLIRDVSRATVTWAADSAATGWRLYHGAPDQPGRAPGIIELPATAHSYDVNLRAGQVFHVALQARGAACDSTLSQLQRVTVP